MAGARYCDTAIHNERTRELMDKILAEVVALENAGYQFEAAGASFDLLVRRCAGTFTPHFERLKYHVEVGVGQTPEVLTEATVKIGVGDDIRMITSTEGKAVFVYFFNVTNILPPTLDAAPILRQSWPLTAKCSRDFVNAKTTNRYCNPYVTDRIYLKE